MYIVLDIYALYLTPTPTLDTNTDINTWTWNDPVSTQLLKWLTMIIFPFCSGWMIHMCLAVGHVTWILHTLFPASPRQNRGIYERVVHQSVHPCIFLHDLWMDFLHIWYHDQVPWATDAYKIKYGSVPNLSNLGIFPPKFCHNVYLLWYLRKCVDFVHIWYSNQVSWAADACKIALWFVLNYGHIFILCLLWYLREEWVVWFFDFVHIW